MMLIIKQLTFQCFRLVLVLFKPVIKETKTENNSYLDGFLSVRFHLKLPVNRLENIFTE